MCDIVFEVYKDEKREWRWRLKHLNGNILAGSSEGYTNKQDCIDELVRIKNLSPLATIQYLGDDHGQR